MNVYARFNASQLHALYLHYHIITPAPPASKFPISGGISFKEHEKEIISEIYIGNCVHRQVLLINFYTRFYCKKLAK